MNAQTYITSDGDTIDRVAAKHYGILDGLVVERIYQANPGLADYGPHLPAGVRVQLPVLDAKLTKQATGTRLWA